MRDTIQRFIRSLIRPMPRAIAQTLLDSLDAPPQSRRTNILVGDDVLKQISDAQNVAHQNGVATIAVTQLENGTRLVHHRMYSQTEAQNPVILRDGWQAARELATKSDLADYALKSEAGGGAATWDTLQGKPDIALKSDLADYALKSEAGGGAATWDALQGRPETFPASWHDLQYKPETYPASWHDLRDKPTFYERYFVPVSFDGVLTVGQARIGVLPASITGGAILQNITALLLVPATSGTIRFRITACRPKKGIDWKDCFPSPSPIYQDENGLPYGFWIVPQMETLLKPDKAVDAQTETDFPNTRWKAGDMIKIEIVETCPEAASAAVVLEFEPTFKEGFFD